MRSRTNAIVPVGPATGVRTRDEVPSRQPIANWYALLKPLKHAHEFANGLLDTESVGSVAPKTV